MIAAILMGAALAVTSPTDTVTAMFAAFNRHDPVAMAALYLPDARLTSSDFCAARTGRGVVRTYTSLFAAFPDLHDDVDTLVADGDRVAVRFTATSRSTGFSVKILTILWVRDGLIVEDDSVFDAGGRPCTP